MVQPSQLLENFCMTRIVSNNTLVRVLCEQILDYAGVNKVQEAEDTYVLLLFIDMPNLTRYPRGREDWEGYAECDQSR